MQFINHLLQATLIISVTCNDQYIVVLKDDVRNVESHIKYYQLLSQLSSNSEFTVNHIFDSVIMKGYSGIFDSDTIDFLEDQDEIDYIELDSEVSIYSTQDDAPWGLSRLSRSDRVGENATHQYHYAEGAGSDVNVYIIDTGIDIRHADFEGRAKWGITTDPGRKKKDGNGHGTHVAGTVAGKLFGVAKNATLIAVKVLDDSGSGRNSAVIKGIEWAALNAKNKGGKKGNVANISLGGRVSKSTNLAVKKASKYLSIVVAAGNESEDACNSSPASEPSAITVAASNSTDGLSWFSNFGECVDFIAPGSEIVSDWIDGQQNKTISGTSMAAPHVAGVVAYLMSLADEKIELDTVVELVQKHALIDQIFNNQKSPNFLVNNGYH